MKAEKFMGLPKLPLTALGKSLGVLCNTLMQKIKADGASSGGRVWVYDLSVSHPGLHGWHSPSVLLFINLVMYTVLKVGGEKEGEPTAEIG